MSQINTAEPQSAREIVYDHLDFAVMMSSSCYNIYSILRLSMVYIDPVVSDCSNSAFVFQAMSTRHGNLFSN